MSGGMSGASGGGLPGVCERCPLRWCVGTPPGLLRGVVLVALFGGDLAVCG